MAVSAPTDRRFRRAHVSPTRRRNRLAAWRRGVVYAAVASLLAAYGGYQALAFVERSELLTIQRVTVSGNTRLSRGEVLSLLDGLQGRNMLWTDLGEWRERLLASPWVADADLRRVLPGGIDVAIVETQPIGIGRVADALYLIDEGGGVIDEFGPLHADFDLPVIDGLSPARGANGDDPVDGRRAMLASRVIAALDRRPDLAALVSEIDVRDPRSAAVILKGDTALVRLGDDQFAERLQSYLELAPALREHVPDIDSVDLRFGERVYVRPQGTGARTRGVVRSGNRTRSE